MFRSATPMIHETEPAWRLHVALARYRAAEVELLIALRARFPHGTPLPSVRARDGMPGDAEVWSSLAPLCLADVLHNVHLRAGSPAGQVIGVPLADLLGSIGFIASLPPQEPQ